MWILFGYVNVVKDLSIIDPVLSSILKMFESSSLHEKSHNSFRNDYYVTAHYYKMRIFNNNTHV